MQKLKHRRFFFSSAVRQQDETIRQFAELGIKVMISELDVSILPDPPVGFAGAEVTHDFEARAKSDPYKNGLPQKIDKKLADRYGEILKVYLAHRRNITRITFWNVTDGDSWLNNFPVHSRTNYPLLFDRMGNPKSWF